MSRDEDRALYRRHADALDDFWDRRGQAPCVEREFLLFGRPARLTSNHEGVLDALSYSLPLFSEAPRTSHSPLSIHIAVREPVWEPGPPPEDLFAINQYTGHAEWLAIQVGGWGHCQVDLSAGRARAVILPALAARPAVLSRGLLNTILLNLLTGQGFCMMHCTGLLRGERALLLMAPHNSGKSTTALRLVRAGYRLLSDSQVYVPPLDEPFRLFAWPVGRAKLREDMLAAFPKLRPHLTAEPVRDETKYVLDLRRWAPEWCVTGAVTPASIDLCLLTRSGTSRTHLTPASMDEVMDSVVHNSIHYDTEAVWLRNLAPIRAALAGARCHHLAIGSDGEALVATIDRLLDRPG